MSSEKEQGKNIQMFVVNNYFFLLMYLNLNYVVYARSPGMLELQCSIPGSDLYFPLETLISTSVSNINNDARVHAITLMVL